MTNDTTTTEQPEASVSQPQRRSRIVRPRDDRIIAGVASGIARHFDVDPWLIRIAAIVLVAFGGAGVLLYGAGWLLLPEEGEEETIAERWLGGLRDSTTWIGVALILVAAVWISSATGIVSAGLAWAVALLVLGVLLYRGSIPDHRPVDDVPARPQPPDVEAGSTAATPPGSTPAVVEGAPRREPRPRRRRSFLGRLTLGTAFVTIGTMALLDATGATSPAFRHYVVAAVLVIGLGLAVGAFIGRSRGLIVLGVLLMPVLVASAAVTAPFTGGFGDPVHRPLSVAEIDGPYRLAAGELTLDLRSLELTEGSIVEIEASVAAGRLFVLVPETAGLEVRAHVGFGEVELIGSSDDGVDVERRLSREGTATLVLDLDVGFGQVDLHRSAARIG